MKKGLCFAGGGIKGIAHIGAIKALEEENIKFDYVGGTSSGSIIACLYACGFKADEMYEIFNKYSKKIKYFELSKIFELIIGLIFSKKIIIDGLNSGKKIERYTNKVCMEKNIYNIKDIKMPLIIPSVNLNNGELICFTSCEFRNKISDNIVFINDVAIGKAVRSSCSFPVIFSPCPYKNIKLIDGGIRENVPWKELKYLGAEKVVNFVFEEENNKEEKDVIEIAQKSFNLLLRELSNYEMEESGLIIKFKSKKVGLLERRKIYKLYKLGYDETKKNINKIKEYLK